MTEDEKKAHAMRLLEALKDNYEYCYVYEDEELEDADEADWLDIYEYMFEAKVTYTFED